MIRRFLQHFWDRGLVVGMALGLLMLIFVPGDIALKLAIFVGVTALALLGAMFTFWRAGGEVPPTVSKRATLARAFADLPLPQTWTRDEPVVGILTQGPNQGRHVMAGLWPEDGFWYAVDGRLHAKGEGLAYEELRSILTGEGARWLEPGDYSDAVFEKYFTL